MRTFYRSAVVLFGIVLTFTTITSMALTPENTIGPRHADPGLSDSDTEQNERKKDEVSARESSQQEPPNDPPLSPVEKEVGTFIASLHLPPQSTDLFHPLFEHGISAILETSSGTFDVYMGIGLTAKDFDQISLVEELSLEAREMLNIRETNINLERAEAVSQMIGSRSWADPASETSGTWRIDPVAEHFVVTLDSSATAAEKRTLLGLAPSMIRLDEGQAIADATDRNNDSSPHWGGAKNTQ